MLSVCWLVPSSSVGEILRCVYCVVDRTGTTSFSMSVVCSHFVARQDHVAIELFQMVDSQDSHSYDFAFPKKSWTQLEPRRSVRTCDPKVPCQWPRASVQSPEHSAWFSASLKRIRFERGVPTGVLCSATVRQSFCQLGGAETRELKCRSSGIARVHDKTASLFRRPGDLPKLAYVTPPTSHSFSCPSFAASSSTLFQMLVVLNALIPKTDGDSLKLHLMESCLALSWSPMSFHRLQPVRHPLPHVRGKITF